MSEQAYINTMDIFPLEGQEQNKLYEYYDLLREGRLATTKCSRCGKVSWPPRTVCPACMSDELEWIDLPKKAKIFAATMQVAGVSPVFENPIFLGLVQFDSGLKILSKLVDMTEDDIRIGREVELTVIDIPGPFDRVLHAFRPIR